MDQGPQFHYQLSCVAVDIQSYSGRGKNINESVKLKTMQFSSSVPLMEPTWKLTESERTDIAGVLWLADKDRGCSVLYTL